MDVCSLESSFPFLPPSSPQTQQALTEHHRIRQEIKQKNTQELESSDEYVTCDEESFNLHCHKRNSFSSFSLSLSLPSPSPSPPFLPSSDEAGSVFSESFHSDDDTDPPQHSREGSSNPWLKTRGSLSHNYTNYDVIGVKGGH